MALQQKELVEFYRDEGYVFIENVFSTAEVGLINQQIDKAVKEQPEGVVYEDDNTAVRGLLGSHLYSDFFEQLTHNSRLSAPARVILGEDMYVHQFKVNFKPALRGGSWPWHQDYIFWHLEDGMGSPQAVNVAVFLDEVDEFNGGLTFISGSHRQSIIQHELRHAADSDWQSTVKQTLKYELSLQVLQEMVATGGKMVTPKGKAGGVLLFHPSIAHGSSSNISTRDRRMLLISYCSISNAIDLSRATRPEFMASRTVSKVHIIDEVIK